LLRRLLSYASFTRKKKFTGLPGSRPNIIFFLADDQSRSDHRIYGNLKAPTPITEAFSRQALVFNKAYTGQAICAPSRSMLLTGLYPTSKWLLYQSYRDTP
jgi:uncharacterized sulfatase